MKEQKMLMVGVEIGGTFTDLILMSDTEIIATLKVPTTPKQPEIGVLEAIRQLGRDLSEMDVLVHGSTIATNAVLERKGAITGLLTTKGFRDILEIQRENRAAIYDLFYQKPKPLIPRDRIKEVKERINADGEVIDRLSEKKVKDSIRLLCDKKNIQSLAISLLHSYKNPSHEKAIKKIIEKKFPGIHISLSSEVIPEFREYERTNTTVINAYVAPIVDRYVNHLVSELRSMDFSGDFFMMQSNGGVLPASAIKQHGVRTLLSGPAAGVIGATYLSHMTRKSNLITLDMGGTSTDVCLVTSGNPEISTDCKIDYLPIKVPMTDIVTVGAGGGSIVWIDQGGMLKVGPQSAGAEPGPACYKKGGQEATVTDSNVIKGLIRPHKFLGGKMPLDVQAAERALQKITKRLKMDAAKTAEVIFKIVNSNMAQAIRLVSVERGYDPREYTLIAYGGAGPIHAACLANDLEIQEILVPPNPGLFSAFGLMISDFKRDYVQTEISKLKEISFKEILKNFNKLEVKAKDEIEEYKISFEDCLLSFSLDMRYLGQAFELSIPVSLAEIKDLGIDYLSTSFHSAHQQRYGHHSPEEEIEIVNYRMVLKKPRVSLKRFTEAKANKEVRFETGKIIQDGHSVPCQFYDRESLPYDYSISGPAIIEEPTATIFIPKEWVGKIDLFGNIFMRRKD
jgi:N-methylhydantoinase A